MAETLVDAYKRGFQDGLNAQKNKPEAYWNKKKIDKRHYYYFCSKCGCCFTVAVENTSTGTDATTPAPAINVQNANLTVDRIA